MTEPASRTQNILSWTFAILLVFFIILMFRESLSTAKITTIQGQQGLVSKPVASSCLTEEGTFRTDIPTTATLDRGVEILTTKNGEQVQVPTCTVWEEMIIPESMSYSDTAKQLN